jgi:hypothetical protein
VKPTADLSPAARPHAKFPRTKVTERKTIAARAKAASACWARGFTVVTRNRDDFEERRVFWKAAKSRLIVEAAPTFPSV